VAVNRLAAVLSALASAGAVHSYMQFLLCRETHSSITKPGRLTLFRERVAVYCENHTEHIKTLCGQNAQFFSGKVVLFTETLSTFCRILLLLLRATSSED
jgi:hypothetical protein